MPRAYCPGCDLAYHATTITGKVPVCEYRIAHGDIVVLLSRTAGRFSRAIVNADDRCDNARSAGTRTDRA